MNRVCKNLTQYANDRGVRGTISITKGFYECDQDRFRLDRLNKDTMDHIDMGSSPKEVKRRVNNWIFESSKRKEWSEIIKIILTKMKSYLII